MKRVWLFLVMALLSLNSFAQLRQGDSSIGLLGGYAFDTENVTVGVDYRICILDDVRIAPSVTYFAKNDGVKAWMIDANLHYVFQLSSNYGFYPLGGVSVAFWNDSFSYIGCNCSDNVTRLGANIGMGAEVYATPELTVGAEVKYHIIKDYDQAMFAVRIAYNF